MQKRTSSVLIRISIDKSNAGSASVNAEEVPSGEALVDVESPSQEAIAVTDAASEEGMQTEQAVLDPDTSGKVNLSSFGS